MTLISVLTFLNTHVILVVALLWVLTLLFGGRYILTWIQGHQELLQILDAAYARVENYRRKNPDTKIDAVLMALGFVRDMYREIGKGTPKDIDALAKRYFVVKHEEDTKLQILPPSAASLPK